MPTRRRAQKHTYLNLEYEESGNQVPNISDFENILKMHRQIRAEWLWHFSKRAREVPFRGETDLEETSKTL